MQKTSLQYWLLQSKDDSFNLQQLDLTFKAKTTKSVYSILITHARTPHTRKKEIGNTTTLGPSAEHALMPLQPIAHATYGLQSCALQGSLYTQVTYPEKQIFVSTLATKKA